MTLWAIYARYSSENQNERSIDDQVRLCRDLVEREGGSVVEIYADYAMSGAHLSGRPNAQRLLADAQAGRFDAVAAEALDRLSRDLEDTAAIFKRLAFSGTRLLTSAEGLVNELHVGLKGTMNALFLKDLAAKVRRGQAGTVAAGRAAGNLTYGYRIRREIDGRGEVIRGLREIDSDQAAVVRRIFDSYARGDSPRSIVATLNHEGIPSPTGGEWGVSTIVGNRARGMGILWNEGYRGRIVYNRVRMVKDPETGRRVSRPNPPSEWQIVEAPDLRIISEDQWAAVQDLKARFAGVSVDKRRRPKRPLSGLIRCGCCGASYTVKNNDQLACSAHRDKGTCDNGRTIRWPELEQRVFETLRRELEHPDLIAAYIVEYHREFKRLADEARAGMAKTATRLKAVERRIANLVEAVAEGFATPEIKDELRRLSAEKAELQRMDRDAAKTTNVIDLHPRAAERFREMIADLRGEIENGGRDMGDTVAKIRAMIERIDIHPGAARGETKLVARWRVLEIVNLARGLPPGEVYTSLDAVKLVAGERYQQYSATVVIAC